MLTWRVRYVVGDVRKEIIVEHVFTLQSIVNELMLKADKLKELHVEVIKDER